MKFLKALVISMALLGVLTACGTAPGKQTSEAVSIKMDGQTVQVDGASAATDPDSAVYVANDIVYYESGKDFTYGEGAQADEHDAAEAAAHTVVHITQPGIYRLSGKLTKGQIAVDLGEDAKDDPNAVVTLVLDGADITCEVAPAIIFYNVYECGSADTENATKDVDTSAAGANVIIVDGSENTVNGAYVARIYKPDSVVLNEAGTEVEDAKKLHKYDAAFYSKMSMNVTGGKESTGVLNIHAQNEGLDSELHLTVNGGNINIYSGNDGINTNEDGVSVTTVNGGNLAIQVTGETGEGDGIDSNGWLVINGGTVTAAACSNSADAGVDSDMGIHINGGTVIASGHMLDRIEAGGQSYAVFNFQQKQDGKQTVTLKDENGKALMECCPQNAYSVLIYSSPDLKEGTYTLWSGDSQLAAQAGGMTGGMMRPGAPDGEMQLPEGNMQPPEEGMQRPEGNMQPPEGNAFDGMQMPDGQKPPEGAVPPERPERPEGGERFPNGNEVGAQEVTPEFKIAAGGNMFGGISPLT